MNIPGYDEEEALARAQECFKKSGFDEVYKEVYIAEFIDGYKEGFKEGYEKEIKRQAAKFAALAQKLFSLNRLEDLERACTDKEFRTLLYNEFQIE